MIIAEFLLEMYFLGRFIFRPVRFSHRTTTAGWVSLLTSPTGFYSPAAPESRKKHSRGVWHWPSLWELTLPLITLVLLIFGWISMVRLSVGTVKHV